MENHQNSLKSPKKAIFKGFCSPFCLHYKINKTLLKTPVDFFMFLDHTINGSRGSLTSGTPGPRCNPFRVCGGFFLIRHYPAPNLVRRPFASFIAKKKNEFFIRAGEFFLINRLKIVRKIKGRLAVSDTKTHRRMSKKCAKGVYRVKAP
jgi:hypothetical protein